jgi:hypothetical protein
MLLDPSADLVRSLDTAHGCRQTFVGAKLARGRKDSTSTDRSPDLRAHSLLSIRGLSL